MAWQSSPFHRFQGWKILALLFVTLAYSAWFSLIGPFSKLAGLAPGMPLEAQFSYSGDYARQVLGQLDEAGQRAKLISLLFDVPYMILNALLFEALIGFGIRRLNLTKPIWSLLFILPLAFLLFDFAEDAFLALTVVTDSPVTAALASMSTPLKFISFIGAILASLILSLSGLIYWLVKGRQSAS